jgi:hypothetical protein
MPQVSYIVIASLLSLQIVLVTLMPTSRCVRVPRVVLVLVGYRTKVS